jgi:hypothetical protein
MRRQDRFPERTEAEAWAKIPKRPQSRTDAARRLADSTGFDGEGKTVPVAAFDELKAELGQLGIDDTAFRAAKPKKQLAMLVAAGVSHKEAVDLLDRNCKPTSRQRHQQIDEWQRKRQQAESLLRTRGLSTPERALVLGRVFDRATTRNLESATGRKKTWIAEKLKSPRVRRAIAELQSGRASPVAQPQKALSDKRTLPEHDLRFVTDFLVFHVQRFPQPVYTPEVAQSVHDACKGWRTLAEEKMTLLRMCPVAITHPEDGPELAKVLVDLLEAAKHGACAGRVRGLLPEGKPQVVARAARKALALLTRETRGGQVRLIDEMGLAVAIEAYSKRFDVLKHEWRTLREEPGATLESSLERLREAHREELCLYPKDNALREALQGKTLDAACKLAERYTGVNAKSCRRLARQFDQMPAK